MYRYLLASAAVGALLATAPASAQPPAVPTQQGTQAAAAQPVAQPQAFQGQPAAQDQKRTGQQAPAGQPQPSAQREAAQQCMHDLQALSGQMDDDGFWVSGYGGPWGHGVMRAPVAAPPAPAGGAVAGGQATVSGTTTATGAAIDPGPWGPQDPYGMTSPRYQIRTLYQAVNVLAHRGDQQGCQAVVAQLRDVYNQHIQSLRAAGVEPGQVTSWRQERIVAAKPVTEMDVGMLSLDHVTGTEVRNAKDRRLGSVNDVVLDPVNGSISHVIVARGGFLGFGRDYVAVPWNSLKATPGLNTFVLNVSEDAMKNAPKVEPDSFADPGSFDRNRQQVDDYWQQQQRAG